MQNKFLSLLGLARRANRLALGYEACVDSMRQKQAKLVLYAQNISPKTQKELCFYAGKYGIPTLLLPVSVAEMGNAVGQKAGIAAVTEEGFARALRKLADESASDNKEVPTI